LGGALITIGIFLIIQIKKHNKLIEININQGNLLN